MSKFNRLVHESSPYLLQHARNPVDWYPWGAEAFEKARREDKPIFLSIGYSTCHWCHVMERESFEDEGIARILNDSFVSVKVDREERPDVDAVYMRAVQAATGSGGWPLSAFLTADGRPFLVGTYFPPEDRFGRVGFRTILETVANAWATKREHLFGNAEYLARALEELSAPQAGTPELGEDALRRAYEDLSDSFDEAHGGFGGAPKFPRAHALSLLLRLWKRWGETDALSMVERTLDALARGGIRDHVGGGFHRYATDRRWFAPHFEKMLYDQALLARAYTEGHQATGNPRYAEVAREIFAYALRDLRGAEGGFYSAEDADSEGVEGRFYVWKDDEIIEILGAEDAAVFSKAYGVRPGGNYRDEATGEDSGLNILHVAAPLERLAVELDLDPDSLSDRLASARKKLFEARERRVRPHRDDKILADWNGLMIASLAAAGRALGEAAYLSAARLAASFVLGNLRADGRLLHSYRGGSASVPAYLDDHAFLALGLLDLYEATFESAWIAAARRLADDMLRLFWDPERGGFFFAGSDAERLLVRTKESYDGAVPSGNSAAALLLLRLARMTGEAEYESRALETLRAFSAEANAVPSGYPSLLIALDFAIGPAREIALSGALEDPELGRLREVAAKRFLPRTVVLHRPEGERASASVCEGGTCRPPVASAEELAAILDEGR
ncbi:MAG: thioredoxin domain-containing protein [Planctomycetota bacterium]